MNPNWISAFPRSAVPAGGIKVLRHEHHQIAVVHTREGELFAINNRCPHEGYPLVQGDLSGCVLTCAWHNFKFDVTDGRCVKGDEDVQTYDLRVVDDMIELDLRPPDLEAMAVAGRESLEVAMNNRRMGQASRDVVRLLMAGVSPTEIAALCAAYDGLYMEYGSSHALPVAADVLAYLPRHPGNAAALPLMQVVDVAVDRSIRRPRRERPQPAPTGADTGAQLREAVERQDAAVAEALVRGAVRDGVAPEVIRSWFYELCADHFYDFGHRLIYTNKAFDLLEAAGWHHADAILGGMIFGVVNGTREDTLPYMRSFSKRLDAFEVPALGDGPAPSDYVDIVLDAKPKEVFEATAEALGGGAGLKGLVDAISLAGARRMLRFDVKHDHDSTVSNNWLDVTHPFTFANAVRHAIARWSSARVVRLVFHAAWFVNHMRALDGPEESYEVTLSPDEIDDLVLSGPAVTATVAAHLIKVSLAAREEAVHVGQKPLEAVMKLLQNPLREREITRMVHQARRLLEEGKPPLDLTL